MTEDSSRHSEAGPSGEAFARRMEDQCEQVERYREMVMHTQGRQLSPDEAALEWIEHFAKRYAEESANQSADQSADQSAEGTTDGGVHSCKASSG